MRKWETMKSLINSLLSVYSGTSQNTSPNEKIFHLSFASEIFQEDKTLKDDKFEVNTDDKLIISPDDKLAVCSDKKTPNPEMTTELNSEFSFSIEEINFRLKRNITPQDTSEVSLILPKTEIKKTYYQDDKITSLTEIVLSNLTILHNPKGGASIVTSSNTEAENSQERPKLTIGFNTDEIEKPST